LSRQAILKTSRSCATPSLYRATFFFLAKTTKPTPNLQI
jgi:hypothetical protein